PVTAAPFAAAPDAQAPGDRRAGLRALLVQPADMPWLQAATVQLLAATVPPDGELIVLPTYRDQDGHPVRFDGRLAPELAALTGERGARALLQRHAAHRIAVSDAGVVRDLDTPADLGPQPTGQS